MTVFQGKAKKCGYFQHPPPKHPPLPILPKRHQKVSKLTMTQNMVLILWIKWQGNTRLEHPKEDGLFSFQNTLNLAAINAWIVIKVVTKNNTPRRVFLQSWLRIYLGLTQTKEATLRKDGCRKKLLMKNMIK